MTGTNKGEQKTRPKRITWLVYGLGGAAVVACISAVIFVGLRSSFEKIDLPMGKLFSDSEDDFELNAPPRWTIHDRVSGSSVIFSGPKVTGYPPLIMVCMEVAPRHLRVYLDEYIANLKKDDPSVEVDTDNMVQDVIDGCPCFIIEYRYKDEKGGTVRAKQVVLKDEVRIYRITCCCEESLFPRFWPEMERSMRSFRRTPIKQGMPAILGKS